MKSKFEWVLTGVLVICALTTTGFVVRHELVGASKVDAGASKPTFLPEWKSYISRGVTVGPPGAAAHVIEFADFECPFCADMHRTLRNVRQQYPDDLSLTYMHFPLPGHRFAMPAARAAECANQQGRFEAMYDQLYDGQDQFGLKPWDDYATAAGIPDREEFDACIKRSEPISGIDAGKALGAKLDVRGTPTIIINGWKLIRPPSAEELAQMVRRILAGKSPVDSKS